MLIIALSVFLILYILLLASYLFYKIIILTRCMLFQSSMQFILYHIRSFHALDYSRHTI